MSHFPFQETEEYNIYWILWEIRLNCFYKWRHQGSERWCNVFKTSQLKVWERREDTNFYLWPNGPTLGNLDVVNMPHVSVSELWWKEFHATVQLSGLSLLFPGPIFCSLLNFSLLKRGKFLLKSAPVSLWPQMCQWLPLAFKILILYHALLWCSLHLLPSFLTLR